MAKGKYVSDASSSASKREYKRGSGNVKSSFGGGKKIQSPLDTMKSEKNQHLSGGAAGVKRTGND